MRPVVHLIDAHVYIFRAYYSLPEMHAPDGTPTNAAYGFANSLIRYLTERDPHYVGCCFDHALTSFRNEIFPAYKSSRGDEAPDDLEPQFSLCREVAEALGLSSWEQEDYEADDVIAAISTQALDAEASVVVVTTDKDLSQLVTEDDRVVLYDLQRERTMGAKEVYEKFGVRPAQIPDYLALVGDTIDDLPGVPGYGKKSAAIALGAFGSLDAIPGDPAGWDGVTVRGAKRLAERFAEHREQALQVRELATVVRAVPGLPEASLSRLSWAGPEPGAFEALCERLGWGRIATRVPRRAERDAT